MTVYRAGIHRPAPSVDTTARGPNDVGTLVIWLPLLEEHAGGNVVIARRDEKVAVNFEGYEFDATDPLLRWVAFSSSCPK